MPSLPRPGDRLAGFRIERELGHGTTGVVYLAHQEGLERKVALKVVGLPLAGEPAFRERFRREARAAAGLDHPNVVQILESGEDDTHLWLAMRLVDGPDLRVLLRRTERLDPEQAVVVVEQIASALDAAHAAGLVHRDVKPGNVLIEDGPARDLHVELADFGLARGAGADAPAGTPGYAAQEQLAGEEAGPAADVYGLGCVLFELLTGTPPPAAAATGTPGDDDRPRAHVRETAAAPLVPSDAYPRLGGAFDPAVERATDPDPAQRFATAGELALWARAALSVPRTSADPPTAAPLRVAAATAASADEVQAAAPTWEIPPEQSRRRRGRKLLVGLFLAAVLAALAVAYVAIGNGGTDERGRIAGARTVTVTGPAGASATSGAGNGSAAGAAGRANGSGTAGAGGAGGASGSGGGSARGTGSSGAGAGGTGPSSGTAGSSSSGARGSGAAGAGGSGSSGSGRGSAAGGDASGSSGSGTASGTGSRSSSRSGSGGGSSTSSGSGTASGPGSSAGPGGARSSSSRGGALPVPNARDKDPSGTRTPPLPALPVGYSRFGGGGWILDLPTGEDWRQTAVQELYGGTRIVTRLQRPDGARLLVEALPGRTSVLGIPAGRPFAVRLPDAGRTDGALYRGGRFAMCRTGVCAAVAANGPSGGVVVVSGSQKAFGAKRLVRRAAQGLHVR